MTQIPVTRASERKEENSARFGMTAFVLVAMLGVFLLPSLAAAAPQGSTITYQGQLFDGALPAGGNYDFELTLYDDAAPGGSVVAGPLTVNSVAVVGGYFVLDLDFGFAWDGTLLHLEIKVKPSSGGVFTTLSPRQPMHNVPAALYAADADTIDGLDSSDLLTLGGAATGVLNLSETLTATDAVIDVTFDHGAGSIAGFGLRVEGLVLEGKGAMRAFEGKTAIDDVGHPQAGRTFANAAFSSGFDASGTFRGLTGRAWAESIDNFDSTLTSTALGATLIGGSEDAMTLSLDGIGTYWVGGAYGEVDGTIDGNAGSGAVAAIIGIDNNQGSATSWAGYFDGDVYTSGAVGIGTTGVAGHLLTLQQGGGNAIADAWTTHSSRRYKADVAPLEGALESVMRLRGVTWRSKRTGQGDLGLIAEEVGEVFPQVVAWEENGVDARGLDYSRLVAVLIEAVKAQQGRIEALERSLSERAPEGH